MWKTGERAVREIFFVFSAVSAAIMNSPVWWRATSRRALGALRINNHDKKQVVFPQRRKGRKGFQAWRLCVLAGNLLVVVSR